jgi:hypothetical protein
MRRDLKYWLKLFAIVVAVALVVLWFVSTSPIAAYYRIHEGMPADEVFAIMGDPTGGDGAPDDWVAFWNRPGCRIVVSIGPDGAVASKEIEWRLFD